MSQLDVARRGQVAVIALNRPEHGNRVSQQMAEELTAALEKARTDPAIGACVLTGRGDVFCLGGDYQGAGPTTVGRMEFARAFIDMNHAMSRLGKPLIAAINGDAHAGGFSIVIACDLAIVADDANSWASRSSEGPLSLSGSRHRKGRAAEESPVRHRLQRAAHERQGGLHAPSRQ